MVVFEDTSIAPSIPIMSGEGGTQGKDMFLNWASSHMFERLAGNRAVDDAAH